MTFKNFKKYSQSRINILKAAIFEIAERTQYTRQAQAQAWIDNGCEFEEDQTPYEEFHGTIEFRGVELKYHVEKIPYTTYTPHWRRMAWAIRSKYEATDGELTLWWDSVSGDAWIRHNTSDEYGVSLREAEQYDMIEDDHFKAVVVARPPKP